MTEQEKAIVRRQQLLLAVESVEQNGLASVTRIQRAAYVGYSRATQLIGEMVESGLLCNRKDGETFWRKKESAPFTRNEAVGGKVSKLPGGGMLDHGKVGER